MSIFASTLLLFWRKRILVFVLLAVILSSVVAVIAQTLSIDTSQKIMRDSLFSFQELVSTLIIVYFIVHDIPNHKRTKTLIALRTRKASLTQFVLHQRGAYSVILVSFYCLFTLGIGGMMLFSPSSVEPSQRMLATLGSFLTSWTLMSAGLMLSTFMTPIITIFCVIALYMLGMAGQFLYRYTSQQGFGQFLDSLMMIIYYITPPFAHSARKEHILTPFLTISSGEILLLLGEYILYQCLFVGVACVLINHQKNYDRREDQR
ncbi:MAG: hypothetical protein NZL83_01145 [Candidatus Absconditabacterales bacterium]|nr:hypothetical protein [Candidatus Absconditabacterales bacterium]